MRLKSILMFSFLSWFTATAQVPASIYAIKMKELHGGDIDFSTFKGKKLLLVNTASKCGLTPQYEGLQKLHEQYGDKVVIIGFPANNFLWQEPGNNQEIAQFCQKNYGVTFLMAEKISVKGKDTHPLYLWLKKMTNESPNWNFSKYAVSADGSKVAFFPAATKPDDEKIIKFITE